MTAEKGKEKQIETRGSGDFGFDEAFVKVTDAVEAAKIDDALGLKMISIRLQNDLINKLKLVANYHGIGYQLLIRNQLHKYIRSELLQIVKELENNEKIDSLAILKHLTQGKANGISTRE